MSGSLSLLGVARWNPSWLWNPACLALFPHVWGRIWGVHYVRICLACTTWYYQVPRRRTWSTRMLRTFRNRKSSFYSEWRCRKKSAWSHKPLQEAENALANKGAVWQHRAEGGLWECQYSPWQCGFRWFWLMLSGFIAVTVHCYAWTVFWIYIVQIGCIKFWERI